MKNFTSYSLKVLAAIFLTGILILNSCTKENSKLNPLNNKQYDGAISSPGMPDLTIDANRLGISAVVKTTVFKESDCANYEGCIDGVGKRKLLRFDVATPNIGTADLVMGNPVGNPLFEYSPCHKHYHFSEYAYYDLLDKTGTNIVASGHKQAFCLEDFARYDPNAGPAKFTCTNQGITVGWQDIYGGYLDCQWIDITNVPPGDYILRVEINPAHILPESNYSNNVGLAPVTIKK